MTELGVDACAMAWHKGVINKEMEMTYTNEAGKTFNVKSTNGKFFYWSPKALRWLPVSKEKVSF